MSPVTEPFTDMVKAVVERADTPNDAAVSELPVISTSGATEYVCPKVNVQEVDKVPVVMSPVVSFEFVPSVPPDGAHASVEALGVEDAVR